jgi:hypothetical protein
MEQKTIRIPVVANVKRFNCQMSMALIKDRSGLQSPQLQ